ncbi:MAG TPA: DUF3473 domain-containing protein, partial [Alphaproteobacteria bacterium]|nr:DUF3473 domain-containing protein [Alphaproteobacteria bacterium]
VRGFRAPVFSLTPASHWVVSALAELGITYSSSIIPGRGALSGYPGAPAAPFRWREGVVELPVPALRLGPAALPYLGGVYLRYLPLTLVRRFEASEVRSGKFLWTYTHPYDIDAGEGYVKLDDGTPLWANWLLMHHRGGFLQKLGRLLQGRAAPPLLERVQAPGFAASLPVFNGDK